MNTDGSNPTNLTADLPFGAEQRSPAWSPDGARIAFVSQQSLIEDVTTSIWTMRADGTDKRTLTNTTAGYDAWPTWSPDGTRIAFIRQYDFDGDITIVSANGGGEVTRIALLGRQLTPSWSPDGASIAFAQPGTGGLNVYTISPAGTHLRLQTTDASWGGGVEPTWIKKR
jgi:Tol biopolymer transport system component